MLDVSIFSSGPEKNALTQNICKCRIGSFIDCVLDQIEREVYCREQYHLDVVYYSLQKLVSME